MQTGSDRFKPFAGLALAWLIPMAAMADLAGSPESSPEVQVYRAIEVQAMRDANVRASFDRLARSACETGDDSAPATPRRTGSQVGTDVFTTFAKCNRDASLARSCGKFASRGAGAWAPIAERIAYIRYFQTLADRAQFTRSLGDDLETMQGLVLAQIGDALRGSQASAKRKAVAKRRDSNGPSFEHAEMQLAVRWNMVLKDFPPPGQRWLPALEVRDAPIQCTRAGERPVSIRTTPPGASVRLISEFDWLVCRAATALPAGQECPGWHELNADTTMLAGHYHYRATWPDGRKAEDTFEVQGLIGPAPVIELKPR